MKLKKILGFLILLTLIVTVVALCFYSYGFKLSLIGIGCSFVFALLALLGIHLIMSDFEE